MHRVVSSYDQKPTKQKFGKIYIKYHSHPKRKYQERMKIEFSHFISRFLIFFFCWNSCYWCYWILSQKKRKRKQQNKWNAFAANNRTRKHWLTSNHTRATHDKLLSLRELYFAIYFFVFFFFNSWNVLNRCCCVKISLEWAPRRLNSNLILRKCWMCDDQIKTNRDYVHCKIIIIENIVHVSECFGFIIHPLAADTSSRLFSLSVI